MNYGAAETGTYSFGDPERTINHKNLINSDTCGKAATALLADHQNEVKECRIRVVDTYAGKAYDVFDTVKVVDDILGISENLRIHHIKRTFKPLTGERTELSLSNVTKLCCSGKLLLAAGEAYLARGPQGYEVFGRTEQESYRRVTVFPSTQIEGERVYLDHITIIDDGGVAFWALVEGSESDDTSEKKNGVDSYKVILSTETLDAYHDYSEDQDWSEKDAIHLWIYGGNSSETIRVECWNEVYASKTNGYYYSITDDFTGWTEFTIPHTSFTDIGTPTGWDHIRCIRLLGSGDVSETYRFDYVYATHRSNDYAVFFYNGSEWRMVDPKGGWIDDVSPVRTLTHAPYSRAWYGSGEDGVVTISTDTDLADDTPKFYQALTIDATKTLSGNSPMFIFVQQKLTLNGDISVNKHKTGGAGGAGVVGSGAGGKGGDGGGLLYVYAREIVGSGKILANAEV